jgi:trans-2,3-dihydro-3-hydroxyanthranilate isomerase
MDHQRGHLSRTVIIALAANRSRLDTRSGDTPPVPSPDETLRVLRYDVFTDRPFAGNPLAVVIDPPALDDRQMQRIAQELNLSETVFLSADGADGRGAAFHARIFTPTTELTFAGHPTVGAALALVDEGRADGHVVLHEGVGPVEVTIADGVATLITARPPMSVDTADPGDVMATIGLELRDLHPELGPRGWSAGVPFTVVGLRDVPTLGRAELDLARWRQSLQHTDAPDLYLLAPLDGLRGERWRARMFGPHVGVAEDPATGSAAAAACGYLAGLAGDDRLGRGWTIEQGVEMGRPSEITVTPARRGNEIVGVRVGGRAVRVGAGSLTIPPPEG